MTLDSVGLEAAAKVLAFRDLAADPDWHGVYEEEWAAQPEEYREAWRESVREVLAPYLAAVVPVTPTTGPLPQHCATSYAAGFAAGRAAATPDPPKCVGCFPLDADDHAPDCPLSGKAHPPAATPDPPPSDPHDSAPWATELDDFPTPMDPPAVSPDERLREAGPLPPDTIRLCVQTHHPIDPGNYEGPIHCTACPEGTPCVTALYVRLEEVNDLRDQVQMYEEKAERDWRDFGEMQDARIAADDRVRELEAQIAACPEDSVSYRVRDRDSDYKAMCHADRDHAELLLKAWLSDGRDAVIESRIVYDAGWSQDVDLAERAARAHRALRAAEKPETNT